jgi:hypothetical protein
LRAQRIASGQDKSRRAKKALTEGRNVIEDLDVQVLEALKCGTQVGRRTNLGQEIVDLVKSQIALLAPKIDETLKCFLFVQDVVLGSESAFTSAPLGHSSERNRLLLESLNDS